MVEHSEIKMAEIATSGNPLTKDSEARLRKYSPLRRGWRRLGRSISRIMPKGLFGRSLIIIITPMLILQALLAYVFMERHWQSVTTRLSAAVVRDVAGLVDVIETYPQDTDYKNSDPLSSRAL